MEDKGPEVKPKTNQKDFERLIGQIPNDQIPRPENDFPPKVEKPIGFSEFDKDKRIPKYPVFNKEMPIPKPEETNKSKI